MTDKWYESGLRFECTGCGKCCTGQPGYVWVSVEEMEKIATFLEISFKEFTRQYVRRISGRFSLIEYKKNYDCVFFKDQRCQIYPVRPKQCATFPFWEQNLTSKEAWDRTAKECEGISDEAPLISIKTIEEKLKKQ